MIRPASAGLALLLLPTPDLLPPGHRAVQHELVLEVPAGTAAPLLVAFPTAGFTTPRRVVPGEPFPFSNKYGTRLYQVAAGENLPRSIDDAWQAAHRSAAIPVVEVHSVPWASPLARVVTTLRCLPPAADGSLQLTVTGEQRFDAQGQPLGGNGELLLLLLPVAVGAGWLWWLARRGPGPS